MKTVTPTEAFATVEKFVKGELAKLPPHPQTFPLIDNLFAYARGQLRTYVILEVIDEASHKLQQEALLKLCGDWIDTVKKSHGMVDLDGLMQDIGKALSNCKDGVEAETVVKDMLAKAGVQANVAVAEIPLDAAPSGTTLH